MKKLLKNGTIVNHDGQLRKDILIDEKKILQISDSIDSQNDYEVIDCTDLHIFPGMVDAHTHMGVPIKDGYSVDDFESGSRSALNGGITTIVDFTVLGKNQTLVESVLERRRLAEKSVIDVGLHCNITRYDKNLLSEIPEIIKMGINSFKVFTTYKEADMMLTYSQIEEISKVVHDSGGFVMVHAEDNYVITKASAPLLKKGFTEARHHAVARPAEAEVVAIKNIANIAEKTDCQFYIVHLNTADGLNIAKNCDNMYVETCPQYLLLDDSYYEREDGRMFVASPPLRKRQDSEAIWNGIIGGSVDVIATDHCPFMLDDKPKGIPFQNIPNGLGGVETMFPVMVKQFIDRNIELTRLVELMSYNPSKIFNLTNRGAIQEGFNADLVLLDLLDVKTMWGDNLISKTDWNAYTEFDAIFPKMVLKI